MSISSVETYKNTYLKVSGVWQKDAFTHILCAMECRDPSSLDQEKIQEYTYLLEIAYKYIHDTKDEYAIDTLLSRIEHDSYCFYSLYPTLTPDYSFFRASESIFTGAKLKLRLLKEEVTGKCSWCDGKGWTYEDVVQGITNICN